MSNILPCSCSKQRIHKEFNKLPRRVIRDAIFDAIMDFRKVSIEQARNVKTLYRQEVEAVMQNIGEPI